MQNIPSEPVRISPPRRWPFYLFGVLLFLIGPAIYFFQFRSAHLVVPWYLPILASLGVGCIILSVMRRRSVLRIVGLVLLTALCGLEWYFLVVVAKNPDYQGPAQVGRPLPTFVTTRADGKPFSNKDLETGTSTALVFYRGHW
jgi:hypothetical protein